MGADSVRVVIAEDEPLIRRGIEGVLADGDFRVVGAAGAAEDLLALVAAQAPDLVVTDIRMPPGFADEGLAAALEIRRAWPAIGVCVLSQHVLAAPARTLIAGGHAGAGRRGRGSGDDGGARGRPGGVGYLLKQRITHIEEFLADLRRIVTGHVVLDPTIVEQLLGRAARAGAPVASLTARQREVLALVAEGRSNGAIAASLVVSEKTVVNHLTSIYQALGLWLDEDSHRRVQAVLAYLSSR